MADRNVATDDTVEDLRSTYNSTSTDIRGIANLNNTFTGTPTDVVEAIGTKSSKGFSIASTLLLLYAQIPKTKPSTNEIGAATITNESVCIEGFH